MGGLGLGLFERKEGGEGETKFQKGKDTNENRALNDKAVIYYVVSSKQSFAENFTNTIQSKFGLCIVKGSCYGNQL